MSSVKRIYLAVAGGLVATGLVLAAIGFVASGFNLAVFNTQIDLLGFQSTPVITDGRTPGRFGSGFLDGDVSIHARHH